MPRQRRQILSQQVYEICFRTQEGLPFVHWLLMRLLIRSVIARVQRDLKVELCHFLWMANHVHLIIVALDAEQCTRFYGQIQKQLTDIFKYLLGKKSLKLWKKNSTQVSRIDDLEEAKKRIAYLYNNPTKANLVERIADYSGLSTWGNFLKAKASVSQEFTRDCPWIRLPAIPRLPALALSARSDASMTEKLVSKAKIEHTLVIKPNLWMKSFDVEDDEVKEINSEIKALVEENEKKFSKLRKDSGQSVKGAASLRRESLDINKYKPKKFSRSVFILSSDNETRMRLIEQYVQFCALCDECYQSWKIGDYTVTWPPGAFRPAMPPTANYYG